MKKLFFACILGIMGLVSCDYGDGWDGYQEEIIGGPVQMVTVSPSKGLLYKDSQLPRLTYFVAPLGAADTTVIWSSNKPEILQVDPETGKLSWGTPANADVIISATSTTNSEVVGTCVFTIRNANGRYRYVDARKQAGLWVLDRNLGASTQWVDGGNPMSNNTWSGNFYHYGNNEPVANKEYGGNDGKGGYWEYDNGRHLLGGYENYDPYWNDTKEGFVDWKNPDNVIDGMNGWRLPTKEELEKLAYYMDENNFRTAADKGAAKYFKQEMALGNGGILGGESNDWKYEYGDVNILYSTYIWSSDYDPATKKAWVLRIRGSEYKLMELSIEGIACPLRLVRDAADFGGDE